MNIPGISQGQTLSRIGLDLQLRCLRSRATFSAPSRAQNWPPDMYFISPSHVLNRIPRAAANVGYDYFVVAATGTFRQLPSLSPTTARPSTFAPPSLLPPPRS